MQIGFILGEFFQGLRRNVAMALSIMLVTMVSLSFVGAALLFQGQIVKMQDYWYNKVEVSIFLCTKDSTSQRCATGAATQAQRDDIETALKSGAVSSYVQMFEFETNDQAFARFKERFADRPELYENITAEQLPESFRVKLKDPTQYRVLAQYFSGKPGVEEVNDQRKLLEGLFRTLNNLTGVSVFFAAIMTIAAVLLVTTTIRLSAFNRRREVGIMRLVGASNAVIQLPFLLEGVAAACVGALLANASLWSVLNFRLHEKIARDLNLSYVGTEAMMYVAPALFILAIALSGAASAIALNKYLKV